MENITKLKKVCCKPEFAALIGVPYSSLFDSLYKLGTDHFYTQFRINKKNGGVRMIAAPDEGLKHIQRKLAYFLSLCWQELEKEKKIKSGVSHGFLLNRSIMTNAKIHRGYKNVINFDLSDFFGSINFGRIRGFFIKNRNFKIDPGIATVIAHAACYNGTLPQGAPTSPIISNMICESLDSRMIYLAKKHGCTYSRYADDLTISTRKKSPPGFFVSTDGDHGYIASKSFEDEILSYGFSINRKKTRVQYKDSRQDVTGLVVNKKIGVRNEYVKTVRAQCDHLFKYGYYFEKISGQEIKGSITKLGGRLNFIDQVDSYNRNNYKHPAGHIENYHPGNGPSKPKLYLNKREFVFAKFIFYRKFVINDRPVVITEGKTDVVYVREAVRSIGGSFPLLAGSSNHEGLKFINRDYKHGKNSAFKRMRFFFGLGEGAPGIAKFIKNINEFNSGVNFSVRMNPVIIFLDNDTGVKTILESISGKNNPFKKSAQLSSGLILSQSNIRQSEFLYLGLGFYLVLTPRGENNSDTDAEVFFNKKTLGTIINGKTFNSKNDGDTKTTYGKNTFAQKVILNNKGSVSFHKFRPILKRLEGCIKDYRKRIKDGTA